jgi:8-oxo-dGTP pyrophosphatase MutT (NUDIX family)
MKTIRDRIRVSAPNTLKHQSKHQFAGDSRFLPGPKNSRPRLSGRLLTVDGASLQYAALPYRAHEGLEFLLITSRETGRWVLPKGWPMKGKKPHACAALEAFEEAGVKGKIGKRAVGCYRYVKRLPKDAAVACSVDVYPLIVERQMKRWPEQDQRSFGWFSACEAASLVDEDELAILIESFAVKLAL